MAKGKDNPTSKLKAKKVEPAPEKAAKKKEAPSKELKVKKKKVKKEKVEVTKSPVKISRYEFPSVEKCQHLETKRTIDRRLRAMHVCTNPNCRKVVRYGAR